MWFRQVQLLRLTASVQSSASALADKLEPMVFVPCLPSTPSSAGWVPPIEEEDAPLAIGVNGCIMVCLQVEEKILPASVVTQAMKEKIKKIEAGEARKVRSKEKLNLKDEITHTLLTRAFSRLTRLFAYIDTRNNWLVINSTSPAKVELFLSVFKKTLGDCVEPIEVIKPSTIITQWLKTGEYPKVFSIEKSCVLQDPEHQNRVIRCQEQDLFAGSIQSLVKDGCEAIQMALCWQDRLNFVLVDDFTLRGVRLSEDDLAEIQEDIETKQQRFAADLVMMSTMLTGLFTDLLNVFSKEHAGETRLAATGS